VPRSLSRRLLALACALAALVAAISTVAIAQTPPAATPAPAADDPADNFSCRGHTAKAADSSVDDPKLEYTFGCSNKIIGYFLTTDQDVLGFDADVPVQDAQGVTSESFACEGLVPAAGFGCFGGYSAGGRFVKSSFSIPTDPCAVPRVSSRLIVVLSAKGNTAGPFDLGRPQGCPKKTTQLQTLRAMIDQLKISSKKATRK
jgi:hypothetical protein